MISPSVRCTLQTVSFADGDGAAQSFPDSFGQPGGKIMDGMTLPPSPMQALQAEHERLLGRLDDAGGAPCTSPTPPAIDKLSYRNASTAS